MNKGTKICIVLLLLLSLLSGCSLNSNEKTVLSKDNIKEHLTTLISPEFEGRMIGTKGNEKAIEYVEDYFKDIGLVPVEGDSFTQEFKALNISYTGSPIFNVLNQGGVIVKSYSEGLDYKVRLDNNSMPGDFTGDMKYLDDKQSILKNEYNYEDFAIILDYNNKSIQETYLSESQIDDRIFYKDAKVLIYPEEGSIEKKDLDLGTKNSWGINNGIIKLGMSQKSYQELFGFNNLGYKLQIHIPIEFNEVKSTNVVGMIPGRLKDFNNIIIATSLDGYGKDGMGNIFPGAVDNGAATSLLIELSRVLTKENKKWDSNIIFLALNGNKLGDRGFDNFLRLNNISKSRSQVIYLDKIGSQGGELTLGTYNNPKVEYKKNQAVFNKLLNTIETMDYKANQKDGYFLSDYINFRYDGIIASVITHGDNQNIGTPNDDIDNVNLDSTLAVGDIVLNYINNYGSISIFSEIFQLLRSTWWLILIAILLILSKFYNGVIQFMDKVLKREKNVEEKSKEMGIVGSYIKDKPVVSVYLILMFYFIVLIMQAKQDIFLNQGVLIKDIHITATSVVYALLNNILSTGPMIAFLSFFIFPLIIVLVVLRFLKDKIKLTQGLNFGVVAILSYVTIVIGFGIFYNYEYAIIMPLLLSLPKAHLIVILAIGIYSFLVAYIISKELESFSNTKLLIVFIIIFLFFVSATYSPYLFNKTIITYRGMGGRIRL